LLLKERKAKLNPKSREGKTTSAQNKKLSSVSKSVEKQVEAEDDKTVEVDNEDDKRAKCPLCERTWKLHSGTNVYVLKKAVKKHICNVDVIIAKYLVHNYYFRYRFIAMKYYNGIFYCFANSTYYTTKNRFR
jgi:hypothetical protein